MTTNMIEMMHTSTTPKLETPTVTHLVDAEVDIEVLKLVPKQFAIVDEKTANWLVKKIISARQYAQRVKDWAEQEQRRAEREEMTLLFLFGRQIENWAKEEITLLNGKRKSLGLPAGTVGFRTIAPKLVIDDENVVLKWAKENLPAAVAVVEKLSKSAINDYAEQTGVVPDDGIHMEPAAERFFIK
jgi:phage host-nuclease inhibitor protein Gam